MVFDDAMLPLLRPLAPISIRPTPASRIRVGDVVAYRSGGSIRSRRVIASLREGGRELRVLQGDNRFDAEPPLPAEELLGRVVRVGARDLTGFAARLAGRLLAFLSRAYPACCRRLAARLPRGRRRAVELATRLHPTILYNRAVARGRPRARAAAPSGAALRPLREEDDAELSRLWNECFPGRPMDAGRFRREFRASPWFSPADCWLAEADGRAVGFLLAGDRGGDAGVIECLGVRPAWRRRGVATALLERALAGLRGRGLRVCRTGRFPAPEEGAAAAAFLSAAGFEAADFGQRAALRRQDWDPAVAGRLRAGLREAGVEVRPARVEDRGRLEEAVRRWRQRWHQPADMGAYVVAEAGGRMLGYCRALMHEETAPYDQFDWLWDAAPRAGESSVGFVYVDPGRRAEGLGAALVACAIDELHRRGFRTLYGNDIRLPGLMIRYRRWGFRPEGGVITMSRRLDREEDADE